MSAKDADAYLAKLSADKRATLEKVRKAIRAAAPDAEEGMSYGMPAFKQDGHGLVGEVEHAPGLGGPDVGNGDRTSDPGEESVKRRSFSALDAN